MNIQQQFGNIDVYLFDQLLRKRLRPDMKVLDAGCGGGRNLVYLLREGYDVSAVDNDADSIDQLRALASDLSPALSAEQFVNCAVETMPFPDTDFDFIICNAVLHFARDTAHFEAMISEMTRVLRPGGILFARLMSTVGVEELVRSLGDGRYRLPNGQHVFLVDEELVYRMTREVLSGQLLDPLKSTVVLGQRSMMTWTVRREV